MTATVIKAGSPIRFAVTAGENGAPASATTVHLSVLDDAQVEVWSSDVDVDWTDALDNGVTFDAAASEVAITSYRIFKITYTDGALVVGHSFYEVIVEPMAVLQPFVNSFATWGQLVLVSRTIAGMTGLQCCTITSGGGVTGPGGEDNAVLVAAFVNAWHNIANVTVDFWPPKHRSRWRPQDRIWDGDGIFDPDIAKIHSTRDLTPELWADMKQWQKDALIRAQVIEANFLLSGNTPEKQRYSGLLSHSAGESAYFYRSFKPLELPVSKATANALKGIITYVTRIGG